MPGGWWADRVLGLPLRGAGPVEVTRGLRVPMPDGVVLLADRYRPRGAAALPVVLLRSPYGRGTPYAQLLARPLARRGLQVVLQSVRGTFGSAGEFAPFVEEREDGLATVAWLRAQPWCDGRVAMGGPSYLGYAQWAVAGYLDEPLAAMAVSLAGSQFHNGAFTGGAFQLQASLSWVALLARQEREPLAGLLPNPLRDRRERRGMRRLPLREAGRAAVGRRLRVWEHLVDHADPDDPVWASADHSGAVAGVRTPVSLVTGWRDVFLPGALRDFQVLRENGRRARITVGPWAHSQLGSLRAAVRDEVDWFGRWLGSGGAGADDGPVRLFLQRAGRWSTFSRWPPTDRRVAWWLNDFGRLDPRNPPRRPGVDRFVYRPADPTPTLGGPAIAGRCEPRRNGPLEERADTLIYTGPVLAHHLDVVGEVSAEVFLRDGAPHGLLYARLCDVDRSGRSWDVCDGALRLAGGAEPGPDGTLRARVVLWPTAYRFRRGHRVRLLVAGGCFPRFPREHGLVGAAAAGEPVDYDLLHDPDHPSALVLPVLPRARPPAARRAAGAR